MVNNASPSTNVLGVNSLKATLPVVAIVLIALFVTMRPEASEGLDLFSRVIFWTVHIGLGLLSLLLVSVPLAKYWSGHSLWLVLSASGVLGAAALAPTYWALEQWLPGAQQAPDDWLDEFATGGTAQALLVEFVEVVPTFLAAWLAVNLPLLLAKTELDPTVDLDEPPPAGHGSCPRRSNVEDADSTFFDSLPAAIGRDVIMISSDLHYLHVHTTAGKALVLGSLRDVANALASIGLQTHRSYWVAHAHVERLAQTGRQCECVMSNGMRVPISRRRRAVAKQWYGQNARLVPISAAKRAG